MTDVPTFAELVDNVELSAIRQTVVDVLASQSRNSETTPAATAKFHVADISLSEDGQTLSIEFHHIASIGEPYPPDDDSPLLRVHVHHIADFSTSGLVEPEMIATRSEVLAEFAYSVALMAVTPYVRQSVNSLAAKAGYPGIVLPLVKRMPTTEESKP